MSEIYYNFEAFWIAKQEEICEDANSLLTFKHAKKKDTTVRDQIFMEIARKAWNAANAASTEFDSAPATETENSEQQEPVLAEF